MGRPRARDVAALSGGRDPGIGPPRRVRTDRRRSHLSPNYVFKRMASAETGFRYSSFRMPRSYAAAHGRSRGCVPRFGARALLAFVLAGLALGLAFSGEAATHAAVPNQIRPSLAHRFWGVQDGAPDEIASVAQTADGYLWLGTASGLYRFDGMRFERFRPLAGPDLMSGNVRSVFAPPTGGLWIGYRFGGFSFLNDGRVTNYDKDAATTGTVVRFAQGPDGVAWAVTPRGVWRFSGSQWEPLGADWNPPGDTEHFFGFDRAGYLWARDLGRLMFLRPGGKRFEIVQDHLEDVEFQAVGFML